MFPKGNIGGGEGTEPTRREGSTERGAGASGARRALAAPDARLSLSVAAAGSRRAAAHQVSAHERARGRAGGGQRGKAPPHGAQKDREKRADGHGAPAGIAPFQPSAFSVSKRSDQRRSRPRRTRIAPAPAVMGPLSAVNAGATSSPLWAAQRPSPSRSGTRPSMRRSEP